MAPRTTTTTTQREDTRAEMRRRLDDYNPHGGDYVIADTDSRSPDATIDEFYQRVHAVAMNGQKIGEMQDYVEDKFYQDRCATDEFSLSTAVHAIQLETLRFQWSSTKSSAHLSKFSQVQDLLTRVVAHNVAWIGCDVVACSGADDRINRAPIDIRIAGEPLPWRRGSRLFEATGLREMRQVNALSPLEGKDVLFLELMCYARQQDAAMDLDAALAKLFGLYNAPLNECIYRTVPLDFYVTAKPRHDATWTAWDREHLTHYVRLPPDRVVALREELNAVERRAHDGPQSWLLELGPYAPKDFPLDTSGAVDEYLLDLVLYFCIYPSS